MTELKTKEEELQEVLDGKKPSALGYWENLSNNILVFKLQPVYGRFYDMAIALTKENLDHLVLAYYMPLSREADIEIGKALGYDEQETIKYVDSVPYPQHKVLTKEERTKIKINAVIEKRGIEEIKKWKEELINDSPLMLKLIEKECVDKDIILNMSL